MNGHDGRDSQSEFHIQKQETDVETMLETHIANVLQHKASQVQFTAGQRERVMRRVRTRSKHGFFSAPALVFAASLVVILAFASYLFLSIPSQTSLTNTTSYVLTSALDTPDTLAHGGQLVSLDPTQHHIVYQRSQEQGVMYTTDINNPVSSNKLAMRYARDVTWAPDGSALVTTIYPNGATVPLLALVHTGHYMSTLGHSALASSWSPTSPDQIVYATQENGTTKLWSTPPLKGHPAGLIATLPISSLVQRMVWSPDGKELTLITVPAGTLSPQQLSLPGHSIYIMDMNTHNVHALPLPSNTAIGNVAFSPNGHYLTYEQILAQTPISLHTLNIGTHQEVFTIKPQHTLQGWSWASDSNALVYSDGGTLTAHVIHGKSITFPKTNATNPLCLSDGRILAVNVSHDVGKLEILSKGQNK